MSVVLKDRTLSTFNGTRQQASTLTQLTLMSNLNVTCCSSALAHSEDSLSITRNSEETSLWPNLLDHNMTM